MIETALLLTNHSQCNFCRKTARVNVSYQTTENSKQNIQYCEEHLKLLKKSFIEQILIESDLVREK